MLASSDGFSIVSMSEVRDIGFSPLLHERISHLAPIGDMPTRTDVSLVDYIKKSTTDRGRSVAELRGIRASPGLKDENQRIVVAREEERHALRHQRRAGDRLPDRVAVDGAARRFVRIAQEPVVGTSAAGRADLNGEARILAAQFAGINAYLKG